MLNKNVICNSLEASEKIDLTCTSSKLEYNLSNERSEMSKSEGGYEGYRPEDVRRAIEESFGSEKEIRGFPLELQLQELFEWSKKCSNSIDVDSGRLVEYSSDTAEHKVWYDPIANLAIKKTWSGNYGFVPRLDETNKLVSVEADLVSYLKRLELQNRIFGDEVLILEVLPKEPSMVLFGVETLPIVSCQPWHEGCVGAVPFPKECEVEAYLLERNFKPVADSFYGWVNENAGIYILDAKPDNFILTADGIRPIDLQMSEV